MFPEHRPHGICITVHSRRVQGACCLDIGFRHMFSAHDVPLFVDACAVWPVGLRKELKFHCINSAFFFGWCVYCHRRLVSLVGGGTSQSLGTRLWMPVLRYVESNLQLSLYLFYIVILVISFLISCDKLVHAEFMLYIYSLIILYRMAWCILYICIYTCM